MRKKILSAIVGLSLCTIPVQGNLAPATDFTLVAEKAMPATVFIKVELAKADPSPLFDFHGDDFFRRFFGGTPFQQPQERQPQIAGGSGFIITPDGYIVTNNHVVKDAAQITVVLNDEREYTAVVKGTDPHTDIALLKIEEKELPYLSFGDSEMLKVGEWVVATGNPCGLEATLTAGVVSAKGRQGMGLASYEEWIQTDTAVNRGNSGGPLLNLKNQVIGINTAIFSYSGGYMGISFAIPSNMAASIIEQLKNSGSVKRAYLGVVLQPVDKTLANALHLGKQEGILISEVVKGSPAAKAGLQDGDIILQYNKKPVKNVAKFHNEIGLFAPGTSLDLQILRDNKTVTLSAILDEQTDGAAISTEVLEKLGLQLDNITSEIATKLGYNSEIEGVVISKVKPGSPAAIAGIHPSFLITGVAVNLNKPKKVRNITDFEDAMKEFSDHKHIILIVRHQNHQKYYTMKIN
jgi:serine protease Do